MTDINRVDPETVKTPARINNGWVATAEHAASPNHDDRPVAASINLIVIHAISLPLGQFTPGPGFIDGLFLNTLDTRAHPDFLELEGVRVSAHFLIRRNGCVIQFVSTEQRAWHAGVSEFMGRTRCNDFSIGIELEGSDFVPFEAAQYLALADLTAALLQHYPIQHIVGHQDIAPDRKTDPGPFFDWPHYQICLQQGFPLVLANAAIRFRTGH